MLNLDPAKLLVIGVVAVIFLGPDRLPQLARQVGGVWRSFNDYRHRLETEVRSSMPDLPTSAEIARLARSPSALLHHLSTMCPEAEVGTVANPASGDFLENAGSRASTRAADLSSMPTADPATPGSVVSGDPDLN